LGTGIFANECEYLFALGLQHDEVPGGFGFEFVKHDSLCALEADRQVACYQG
jgi:hypothetical protein